MKIVQFGGQSLVNGKKNELLKEIQIYDNLINIIEANDDITYRYAWVRNNIDAMHCTGDFELVSNKKVLVIMPERYKFLLDLYGIKLKD